MEALESVLMWIISPVILTVAGAWGGWFFGRKLQRVQTIDAATETFNRIIEQLRKEIGVYQDKEDKNAELVAKQSQRIDELTSEVRKLSEEVELLRREKKENILLKKKIERFEKLLIAHNIEY